MHFNEQGEPVGTGDLTLRRKDALQMLQDLKGLAIDGLFVNKDILSWLFAFRTSREDDSR